MSSKIHSATIIGLQTYLVEIEVDINLGRQGIHIVGLPDAAINESKKRMLSAIKNSGIDLPQRSITLNLAPADLKKVGTGFDLPMAVAILRACEVFKVSNRFAEETIFCGELGLDGDLKVVSGIFSIALDAKRLGKKRLIVPHQVSIGVDLDGVEILCINKLSDLIQYFKKGTPLQKIQLENIKPSYVYDIDFNDITGQLQAKRALQIAAAGSHHSIFMGPPGSGKTMLAQRLPTIMEPFSFADMLEVTRVHSTLGGAIRNDFITTRPFRSPHHTISYGGLVGGGSKIQAGEITLSHKGILFLDEVTEFSKKTLEVLRQPLEDKTITISRASSTLTLPADFLLVAAFNPCPCGFAGDKTGRCKCPSLMIDNYLRKLSGPFIDRIDLQLALHSVDYHQIRNPLQNKSSHEMYGEIVGAIGIQKRRGIKNGDMNISHINEYCILTQDAENVIKLAFEKLNLSMRGYHKVLKVARTIADIEGLEKISASHIKEALSYRQIDQKIANILFT